MMAKRTYRARYERDETGTWIVRLSGIAGVHSNGRSIDEARRRVREALAAALDDDEAAERAELVDDIDLPREVRGLVARHARARAAASKALESAEEVQSQAARALAEAGLSLADAGTLLGLSKQRIHQIVGRGPARRGQRG